VTDAPEERRGTTGEGRATDPLRGNRLSWETGSVRAFSSAVRLGFSSEARRSDSYVIHFEAPESGQSTLPPAKARDGGERRERSERRGVPPEPVRGGGRVWRVREDGIAADGRRPTAGEREAVRSAEAVPSAGWRSVARALAAEEGCSHR